jgi:hypothetical protein
MNVESRSMLVWIVVTIAAVVALAIIITISVMETKPYYRDQHRSSIDQRIGTVVPVEC